MDEDPAPSLEVQLMFQHFKQIFQILTDVKVVMVKYLKQRNFPHVLGFIIRLVSNVQSVPLVSRQAQIQRVQGMAKSYAAHAMEEKDPNQKMLDKMKMET